MKKLVRPLTRRVVCDMHTCHNMAEYSIGLEGFSALYINICGECMNDIITQATKLMNPEPVNDKPEAEKKEEKAKPEPEYYVCKVCGEKFVKPDELSKYRSHVSSHNKGVRQAGSELKDVKKSLKVKAPTVKEVLKEEAEDK